MTILKLQDLLAITIDRDLLTAYISYDKEVLDKIKEDKWARDDIINLLHANKITFGILEKNVEKLLGDMNESDFPLIIAKGLEKVDGKAGAIEYAIATSTEVDPSFSGDFRDVMRLPVVEKGNKIATLISPTEGKNGKTVTGKEIKAKPGKPKYLKAGKNISFNKNDQTFYAEENGLVNFGANSINIYTVYELNESVSMRTGNIDFNGSVIIRGDVPSGFTIKATGDIKIFGLVESATIISGGSVYVSEGMSGLKKGSIEAGEDVYIGYINQGNVRAERNIQVEHSILHSECSAGKIITCHHGNIIGGSLFASVSIEAKDIGNHINTPTNLALGIDDHLYNKQIELEEERQQLIENIKKIETIRAKMKDLGEIADAKTRINALKLTNSFNKMNERLEEIKHELEQIRLDYEEIHLSDVKVTGILYTNTNISFGKYQRKIARNYEHVIVKVEQSDIIIKQQLV